MALPQEKVTFVSPLNEQQQEHEEDEVDVDEFCENNASSKGCDCFPFSCFGRRRSNKRNHILLHNNEGDYEESWLMKRLKKVKEVSEVYAGPKWKTFIRKVGGYVKRNKYKNNFQYDPQSYALNFDNGVDTEDDYHFGS